MGRRKCPAGTLAADSGVAGTLEDVPAGTPWNERQSWALHELSRIGKLTRLQIENVFHIGEKTAKRDMQMLREADLMTFVRQGRDRDASSCQSANLPTHAPAWHSRQFDQLDKFFPDRRSRF